MSESSTRQGGGALRWVRVIGWQFVALVLVASLGKSVSRMSSAWATKTESTAKIIEDGAKFTGFVADCLPEDSKKEIKALLTDATNRAVREARRELDREKPREPETRPRP